MAHLPKILASMDDFWAGIEPGEYRLLHSRLSLKECFNLCGHPVFGLMIYLIKPASSASRTIKLPHYIEVNMVSERERFDAMSEKLRSAIDTARRFGFEVLCIEESSHQDASEIQDSALIHFLNEDRTCVYAHFDAVRKEFDLQSPILKNMICVHFFDDFFLEVTSSKKHFDTVFSGKTIVLPNATLPQILDRLNRELPRAIERHGTPRAFADLDDYVRFSNRQVALTYRDRVLRRKLYVRVADSPDSTADRLPDRKAA